MKKKLFIAFLAAFCAFAVAWAGQSLKVNAATTEITPLAISRPSEIDSNRIADVGIAYTKEKGEEETIYTIEIPERGWVVMDVYSINGSICKNYQMYRNSSLTVDLNSIREYVSGWVEGTYSPSRYKDCVIAYYLDKGTYYLKDMNVNGSTTFMYYLPNSAVIKHELVKEKDNNGYTDTITFTPHIGTTSMVSGIVNPQNINGYNFSDLGKKNADNVYEITGNGEYTVRASFTDTEWKDFPVMYSFEVYDIGKGGNTSSEGETSGEGVELSETKKSLAVGGKFELTLSNAVGDIKWKSSKTSVAKVEDGVVTAVGTGTATISATYNGNTYKCKVTVSGSAGLNHTTATLKVGETLKLKVSGAKALSFKSSKKSVAKVKASGTVVAKKAGTTTIKVTCDNGQTYSCKVTVKK